MSDAFILLTTEQIYRQRKRAKQLSHRLTLFVEQVAFSNSHTAKRH